MDILLGVGTASVTAIMFCWVYGAHRKPVPAGWTRWPGASMLVCVAMTLLFPLSIGLLIKAALHPVAEIIALDLSGWLIIAGATVAALVLCPVLIRPALREKSALQQAVNRNVAPTHALDDVAA
jgi:hypothetical protein